MRNKQRDLFYNYKHLDTATEIPGMISHNEKAFLQYYTAYVYTGIGEIVDLGTWLGVSSEMLAKGLSKNKMNINRNKRIYAYDKFIWDESLESKVSDSRFANKFKPGDNYKNTFEENLEPFLNYIEVRGDVFDFGWHKQNIEFLFIDAMKNPWVTDYILKYFYPYLVPGLSTIVYQDFDHYLTPWVHILIYRYRKYFRVLHDIPGSGGFVLHSKKKIPISQLRFSLDEINDKETDKAFSYCLSVADKPKCNNIAAAHIKYYMLTSRLEKALLLIDKYSNKYKFEGSELDDVQVELNKFLCPNIQ